jgi:hypothetical protein
MLIEKSIRSHPWKDMGFGITILRVGTKSERVRKGNAFEDSGKEALHCVRRDLRPIGGGSRLIQRETLARVLFEAKMRSSEHSSCYFCTVSTLTLCRASFWGVFGNVNPY